ncbi:hypothetical protein [Jiulongibacter sp. NS-SX5]|uniref:hypothetical protein n=1 Tax=Jiulongibacter sp. NS-SX5 TaxID=3463854 RepID=UPI00405803D1
MKSKILKLHGKIEALPEHEKEVVIEYFKKNPGKVWGEQRSLLKGHSDLPLFRAEAEENQQKLFDQ